MNNNGKNKRAVTNAKESPLFKENIIKNANAKDTKLGVLPGLQIANMPNNLLSHIVKKSTVVSNPANIDSVKEALNSPPNVRRFTQRNQVFAESPLMKNVGDTKNQEKTWTPVVTGLQGGKTFKQKLSLQKEKQNYNIRTFN